MRKIQNTECKLCNMRNRKQHSINRTLIRGVAEVVREIGHTVQYMYGTLVITSRPQDSIPSRLLHLTGKRINALIFLSLTQPFLILPYLTLPYHLPYLIWVFKSVSHVNNVKILVNTFS